MFPKYSSIGLRGREQDLHVEKGDRQFVRAQEVVVKDLVKVRRSDDLRTGGAAFQ